MKNLIKILGTIPIFFAFLIPTYFVSAQDISEPVNGKYATEFQKVTSELNEYYETLPKDELKGTGYKPFKRWEAFWKPRLYPNGTMRTPNGIYQEYKTITNNKTQNSLLKYKAGWQEVGPMTVPQDIYGGGSGIGRVNCIELHPVDKNTIWIGASMGGAWVTTDRGKSWSNPDFTSFLSMGVSDIKIAESNPNIIYLATGDADGSFMTRGYSIGVIKSTDAGKNWEVTGLKNEIQDGMLISSLYVDPDSSNVVIATTNRGIFLTTDGGENWDLKSDPAFFRAVTPLYGGNDVLLASTYSTAGNCGVYRSEDGGYTWSKMWENERAVRIRFGTTPANEDVVYMVVTRKDFLNLYGVFKSLDSGKTWVNTQAQYNLLGHAEEGNDWNNKGQGQYDLAIAVSPYNQNLVAVGGINIWASENGAKDWSIASYWSWSNVNTYVHADQHYFTFDEKTGDFYVANDGGVYVNTNFPDKNSWEDITSGISAGQFYKIAVANTQSLMTLTGAQDNGTHMFSSGRWYNIGGGDGMDCEINPDDKKIMYWSSQYGNIQATFDGLNKRRYIMGSGITKEYGDWTTPIDIDPGNSNRVFTGYQNVWYSNDQGKNWERYGILPTAGSNPTEHTPRVNVLEVAEDNIVYAASQSTLMKRDGAKSWEIVKSFGSHITSVKPDKNDPHSVWVSLSGYVPTRRVSYMKYNASDGSYEEKNMTPGLPNVPVNDILVMENNETIFAGTDLGVFVKEGENIPWKMFNIGLPYLVVNDLEYNKNNQTLYAGTFGRGLWQTKIYDCQVSPPVVSIEGELDFCEGDSVTLKIDNFDSFENVYWSTGDTIPELTVKYNGSYYAIAESDNGCVENSELYHVNVLSFNEVKARTNNGAFAFCDNEDSLRVSANPGYDSYKWSTGETSIRIYITEPGDYWLECVARNGCVGRHEFTVVESSYPETPSIKKEGSELVCISEAERFQWYNGSREIEGAVNRRYTPAESGTYRVEVFSEGGCGSISDEYTITVGVEDDAYSNIDFMSVYPNPAQGTINIETELSEVSVGNIEIIDINGSTVFNESNISFGRHFKRSLDVSDISAGTYFLRIRIGDDIRISRIIVE